MRIEVKNLVKHFPNKSWILSSDDVPAKKAVDDVSFSIQEKEMFGLIGDSGCGKTTIARSVSALLRPTAGDVLYDGESIFEMNKRRFKKFRQEVRAIFQNPDSYLNPHVRIRDVIGEVFKTHTSLRRRDIDEATRDLFGLMGLSLSFLRRYPYQLSIGQKRKIGLARALAIVPRFLIADEPFAGLDISTKRELTWIMQRLQQKYKFGALVISHDLESVRNLCHRVAVMYKGRILELFDISSLVNKTVYHPYTQILLGRKREGARTLILKGKPCPSSQETIGCSFLSSCNLYESFNHPHECIESQPKLRTLQDNHQVACHLCDRALKDR